MTGIPYLDCRWEPAKGCGGCELGPNCWALKDAWRMAHHPNPKIAADHAGLSEKDADGHLRWTGKVNLLNERLFDPLRRKAPTVYGVGFGGDLFAPGVPNLFLHGVFTTMETCTRHAYVLLTKCSKRLRSYLSWRWPEGGVLGRHIWIGVSVSGPDDMHRVADLLATPAAHKWISYEPACAAISGEDWLCHLMPVFAADDPRYQAPPDALVMGCQKPFPKDAPKCAACGGTGQWEDPRPCAPDVTWHGLCEDCQGTGHAFYTWAHAAALACEEAGVAFSLKQGPERGGRVVEHPALDGRVWDRYPWRESAAAVVRRARGEE